MILQSTVSKFALAGVTGVIAAGTGLAPAIAAQPQPQPQAQGQTQAPAQVQTQTQVQGEGPYKGRVIANGGLNIRSGPGLNHRVIGAMPEGTLVHIKCKVTNWDSPVGGNPRWYKINDHRFVRGFSAARYIKNVGPAPHECDSKPAKYEGRVIANGGLNIRSGPGLEYPVVDAMPEGALVGIKCKVINWDSPVGGNPRWYKIDDHRFAPGYSTARYIKNVGPAPHEC